MATKIDSGFCFLDVKRGRVGLAKRIHQMRKAGITVRIPVTVRGHITDISSQDDGTSIEFEVTVSEATERDR